ncbi:DUF3108 domain-containing protein [Massilia sp.]|uniref:DUF3108 domain-containing protein n=1 Tax=Massilia sp. TaxID=1882437 RepID=UPI00289A4FF5|nr:DUF3108 domain-containing protein [Massilia sp.]
MQPQAQPRYTSGMQAAPNLPPRRHSWLLIALVVLVHGWVALGLVDARLPLPHPDAADSGAATMVAQLLEAPTRPAPAPPAPLPLHEASPPPLPEVAPLPASPEAAQAAVAGDITPDAGSEAASVPAAGAAMAAVTAPAPGAAPASPPRTAVQEASATPPPPPEPEQRRYTVDMPPPARITLDVARTDADGTQWSGEALLAWQSNADTYRIQVEAGIRVVFTRVNLVVLTSEGAVAATGFAPIKMTEKRRGRSLTATHFDWSGNRITFSGSQANYPLLPGAQDKASVPLQLSAIARGDARQLKGDIDIQVGEDRDASVYRFQVVGQEQIDTRLGRLQTWHLTRPPKPGSYKSRLDIWLAPEHGWYPVQIRNTESSGAVTTQTVNNIDLSHSGN